MEIIFKYLITNILVKSVELDSVLLSCKMWVLQPRNVRQFLTWKIWMAAFAYLSALQSWILFRLRQGRGMMLLVRGGSRVGDATRSSGSWSNPWIALRVGENELGCFISSETGASAQETVYLSDARRCREVFSGV
jgi:hypothetical protein